MPGGDRSSQADDGTDDSSTTETEVTRLVRQHWNRRAETFDDQPEHAMHSEAQRERWLEVLAAWIPESPDRTLDVGCGTGTISVLLAELGHDVLGVDAAPAMIERATRKASEDGHAIAFGLGDATTLGLVDDAVDLVVERHLLWTLSDPAAAVDEWIRVLERGGRLVCFEGKWDHEDHRREYQEIREDLPMYHGRSAPEMRAVLEDVGLKNVESAPTMDPVLRGTESEHEYYVVAGTNPS